MEQTLDLLSHSQKILMNQKYQLMNLLFHLILNQTYRMKSLKEEIP